MHLTIIKTALLATIATMAAAAANTTIGLAPQTSDPQALGYQPLGPGPCGAMFCTGANFTGECSTPELPENVCYVIPAPFRNNIYSITGLSRCYCVWSCDEACRPHAPGWQINYPGINDVGVENRWIYTSGSGPGPLSSYPAMKCSLKD